QAPTEGYEDAIVVPAITADNFELKHGQLTLVQNKQFFGHDKADPHAHIRYFNKITSSLKFPNVPNTSIKLILFLFSLKGAAQIWLEKEPPRSIFTWDDLVSKFINQFFPPSKTTNLRNEITNFQQSFDESFSEAWDRFKDLLRACPHLGFSKLHQLDTFYNALNLKDQDSLNSAAGGNFLVKMRRECLAIIESKSKVHYSRNKPVVAKVSTNASSVEESCVTCGGAHSYRNCPSIDGNVYRDNIQEFISQASVVNYNQGNTSYRPSMMSNQIRPPGYPPVVQSESLILNSKPVTSPISEPVIAPSKMPRTPLNEHCSAVLLNKLLEKLGDPGKFLILCDFSRMAECLALVDLGASINLMPWSIWKRLSLPDLTPMCMTLELADRLISHPVGVVDDVYVKVGSFHFPSDFVVVDFDADPRVPLILERSFLKTERALIDVFEGELTLRVGKEAITFNLDQTSRYSANYNEMTAKRIDVIDMACEEYSQEVLGFSDVIASGNPTPYYDPIVSTISPTLTSFENSDILFEEVDAFLVIEDDPTSPKVDQSYLDPEGDILLLEAFLNDDPSLPPPNQGNYLPEVRKELEIYEAKSDKSSIDEPPKSHKRAIAWKLSDIKVIDPEFCTHKILMEEDFEPAVQHQIRVNPKIHDVIKQEVLKLLDAGLIYPISDSPWVSPVHYVPKNGGFTVVENEDNEIIPTRLVVGWRICIDYRKLNEATRKDHFPLPFMDQMLERLAGNQYYCFLDGFSSYFQILIDPKDQEKTTFTCPYRTFAYRRMPFRLCNAPGTFQRCMRAIFHDMIEKTMEVFMDDFLVFENSFQSCLSHLERMLKRCEDTNLCLNWGKSHFMVKDGIVFSHKISKQEIEVDKAKLMCDASDFAIGAVLGQRQDKHFRPIHYASKTMTETESNYTTTKKEMLAVVYAFEKFRSYIIMNKSIMYTDHSALKYLFAKKDSKARLLRWVLLLQEFTFKVIDTKGAENLAVDHLS
nr:reverse transcriptase domain-containing protein [Tanacetum cinerariifolium]